jgi:hypothetical protein
MTSLLLDIQCFRELHIQKDMGKFEFYKKALT